VEKIKHGYYRLTEAAEDMSGGSIHGSWDRIPEPSNLAAIKKHWEDWAEWKDSEYTTTLIALVPSHETRKYTISMDSSLMARIDGVTKNRSAFLAKAAEEFLGTHAGAVS
jgi:hypothetical protein